MLFLCYLFFLLSFDKFIFESFILKGVDMYVLYLFLKKFILVYIIENSFIELLDVVLKVNYNVNRFESNGDVFVCLCLLGNYFSCFLYFKGFFSGFFYCI